tara:strand:+ start:3056 stop:3832 length:777 start_codon:yes stop_codon:yes gene_type:complete
MMKIFTLLLSLALSSSALAMSADEVINKANLAAIYPGDDGRTQARMMIIDKQGRQQTRQFTILRRNVEAGGDQQMLVFFARPSDVRGTVFRVEKSVTQDDDRWLYLPGLDLVRRISAGDKRTSFVGSHFYYEDVSGRNPAEDNFEFIEQTESSYLIQATPKDPRSVEFATYQIKIDADTWLPMMTQYFDAKGKIIRQIEAVQTQEIQGYPSVTRARIDDFSTGGHTLVEFRGIEYNLDLPTELFSERSLRNPPTRYLR